MKTKKRSIARLLAPAFGLALPILLAAPLSAQVGSTAQPGGTDEVITLEAFSVTGSNVRRMDQERVLPVTVINKDAMDMRNAITPIEMLTALPQVTGVPANEAPRGGAGARGDISTVSMRGLAASDSLVLLNGRRLIAHPTTDALDYSVNVNQLPTQGLSQIEVLRDGASAVYGSDAVAGVVNYIMSREFRGTQVRTRYGWPEHGGGENVQLTITHGREFAGGKGRLLTTFDSLYRDAIYLRDRDFSSNADNSSRVPTPFNLPGGPFDGRAGVGYYPTFRVGTATATNYFRPVNGAMTLTATAPTRANNPEFYHNSNEVNMALARSGRINWFTGLEYDLTDRITLFADLSFYKAQSRLVRRPVQINAPTSDLLAPMSVDNPYNPYGSRFYHPTGEPNADGTPRLTGAPRSVTLLSEVLLDVPNEQMNISSGTYRLVGGLRGKLGDTWTWEIGSLYSSGYVSDKSPFHVRESLFHQALMRTTPTTAYNPFGYTFKVQGGAVVADQPYTNSESVVSSFIEQWRRDGDSALGSIDARVSGRLFSLWSGDISMAAGTEFRVEEYRDFRPRFHGTNPEGSGLDPNDNDFVLVPPTPDAEGDRDVTSFYAEAVVPLAAPQNDIPLVNLLEFTASVRHERYSDFGETTKPKFGLNWRPVPTVMVRASYNEGFTAPSLPVLNRRAQWSFAGAPGSVDTYRNIATNEGPYITRTGTSGNPNLQPVDSEGKSGGIVFDVPGVRGLSVSADYWEIRQSNLIGSLGAAQVRNNDMLLLQAYTKQQIAAGVPVGSINLGEGTPAYKGDPAITRVPPTAADLALFASYNAANPGNPLAPAGRIFQIDTPPLNLSEGVVAGWDFVVNYNIPALSIGNITLNTDWSYTTESNTTLNVPGGAPIYNERLNVNGVTRWRGTTTASWRKGKWSGGLSAYYIGSYADSGATTTQAIYESLGQPDYIVKQFTGGTHVYRYRVEDVLSFNAFGGYGFGSDGPRWLRNSTLRLGIINVADTAPPVSSGNFGFGYSGSVHGSLLAGRTWTFEMSKQF